MTDTAKIHDIALTLPQRVMSSGWLEHIPFAMFLVALARPRTIVELGTYSGSSYCAFCQAVRIVGSDTRCYGIDTWRGDPQAGYFGDEVLGDLKKHHDPLYGSFSRLLQSTFDEALDSFTKGSIDLLHIDGHHAYDSVRHDFTQWLPKVSEQGIVLFHDTNVRGADFGVWRLWEEVKPQYPHFEFLHGNGLGIIAVGENRADALVTWLREAADKPVETRNLFAQLGQKVQFIHEIDKLHAEIAQARVIIDDALVKVQQRDEQLYHAGETARHANEQVQQLQAALVTASEAHQRELAAASDAHQRELAAASDAHRRELAALRQESAAEQTRQQALSEAEHRRREAATIQQLSALRDTLVGEMTAQVGIWQQRALAAETTLDALRATKSMRAIARWWHLKAGLSAGLHYPFARTGQLSSRTALMLRTEGPGAVTRQLIRWLQGERRYYGVVSAAPPQQPAEPIAPAPPTSPFPVLNTWSETTLSLQAPADIPIEIETLDKVAATRFRAFLSSGQSLRFPATAQPTVSIVIPVHNKAHITYAMLENLLATSGATPCEVIIIDDCSTDETPLLLERLMNVAVLKNDRNIGFGESCNRGAAAAQGDYICFLNSDTLPIPGWLEALTAALNDHSGYGAAGAKLVFPDLRLQEAGSILWRDGSALGYGRGADAFSPEFNYLREVDYCSAACLMVRRPLFGDLGGFDPRYAPAYYEDADLCLAIREAGYTIAYVPDAVVVHLEHATSGSSRAVELQLRNREAFSAKWGKALRDHGTPTARDILRFRDARPGKRILILDDMIPLMQIGSGFPRTLALLKALAASHYVITYIPTTDPRPYEPGTIELQRLGIEVLYGRTDVAAIIHERAALYDTIIVSRPHNAHLIPTVREANPHGTIIYDAEAVFAFREAQRASLLGQPLTTAALLSGVKEELAPVTGADIVLTVSELERRAIQQAYPDLDVAVWGHAIAVKPSADDFSLRRGIIFVGYLASEPNNDAALLLARDILPLVERGIGNRLTLVGKGASPELLAALQQRPAIARYVGFAEDLGQELRQHRVFVAPHRFAAGIPLKVIEAMAHGIPCVISTLLAEQLGVADDCEVLVGGSIRELGDKIALLHNDERLWRRIRQNALVFIEQHYTVEFMQQKIVSIIGDASPPTVTAPERQ